jgi:hypothetical protein
MAAPIRAAIDQLAYLLDELDALHVVLPGVPDELLSAVPAEGSRSIKELFATIGVLDAGPRLQAVTSGLLETADLETWPSLDPAVNSTSIPDLLGNLQRGRRELVANVEECAERLGRDNNEGMTGVLSYLHEIIEQDTDILRTIAGLLSEGRAPLG